MIVTNEKAFAVAGSGRQSLMVFNKGGLLGEISHQSADRAGGNLQSGNHGGDLKTGEFSEDCDL